MVQDSQLAQITSVQQRYADSLLNIPHVVGLGVGMATVEGVPTGEMALVVMVDLKIPNEQLPPEERIPHEIEGVRVDVQETGMFSAG